MDDEGSVLPLVAVWLAVLVVMAMVVVAVSGAAAGRARAQAAADAVALAGAGGGRSSADAVAAANNATITSYVQRSAGGNPLPSAGQSTQSLMVVTVVVEVEGIIAAAAAERFLALDGFLSGA